MKLFGRIEFDNDVVNKKYVDEEISANVGVFVAVYDQTSYADVKAAIDAHKAIVLDMPANNNQFCMTYSTYTNGGNVSMYAIYKMSDKATLMTAALTPDNNWTITHTDLQDKLVSGTNIKTINNKSLLEAGDIDVSDIFVAERYVTPYEDILEAINAGKQIVFSGVNYKFVPSAVGVLSGYILLRIVQYDSTIGVMKFITYRITQGVTEDAGWTHEPTAIMQPLLESGTNIKTINNQSLLGSGNIDVSSGSGDVFIATGGKTISEIMEAYSAGKVIIAEFSSKYYTVSYIKKQESSNKIVLYSLYTYETSTIPPTDAYAIATFTVTDDGGSPPIITWSFASIDIQEALRSGTNIKTINDTSLLGSGNIDIKGDAIVNTSDLQGVCTVNIGNRTDGTAITFNEDKSDGRVSGYLFTDTPFEMAKHGELEGLQSQIDALGEPFRVKQWGSNTLNVAIPTCTEDISNIDIPKMVYSIDNVEGADYQIVGMIAYEVFDAASGGNRINCWPVCQFTGNGQKELSVRWMCGGTTRKTAKRINAWVLLKHR